MNCLDPRVLKTKKQFKDSFKQLILKYDDYMKITIKELCAYANLNRRTFYLHYKRIDDILIEVQEEAINEFYSLIKDVDLFEDVETVVRAFFDLNENNPVYQKMNSADAYFYAKEISRKKAIALFKEREMLHPVSHLDSVIQSVILKHYHLSISSMYSSWVITNRAIPKEKMIQLVTSLVKNGINSVKNGKIENI